MDIPEISKVNVQPDDVIILNIPLDKYTVEMAQTILESLGRAFPENTCMFLPSDCNISVYSQPDIGFTPATQEELLNFLDINDYRHFS